MDAAGGERIGERAHHRLLADEILEANRPVFSRQNPIRNGRRRSGGSGKSKSLNSRLSRR